jgi:hypothetical protein
MTHPPTPPRPATFAAFAPLAAAFAAVLAIVAGVSCGRDRTSTVAAGVAVATPRAAAAPAPPRAPAHAEGAGYEFRPAERDAVERYLAANPDLRVARDADQRPAGGEGDVSNLYGVYHPYFVRGDANDDGILDFVLAFVRRDSDRDSPWFSVVVFEGRPDGTFAPGAALERDISLADGDLSLDRDSIVVTPDTSEDASRRYRWDPARQRHVFVRDDDEAPEAPPSSQT